MKYSVNRHNQTYGAVIIALFALVALCCPTVAAAANDFNSGVQSGSGSPPVVEGQSPQGDVKAAASLLERVHAQGTLPVIVRMRDRDLPHGFAPAIVQDRAEIIGTLQSMVLDDVSAQTARDETALHVRRFSTIPAMALHVDATGLDALLAHPDVVEIVEDIPLEPLLDESVQLIGGDTDGSFETYTGRGQTIAILDTGVDKSHPFLSGKVVSEACYSTNKEDMGVSSLCPGGVESSTAVNSGVNCDPNISLCGHGTYVAGIAAGSSKKFSGVAKDASIIAIQVFSRFSDCGDSPSPCLRTYSSDVISGMERVYALRDTYAIASVNMSLGGGQNEAACDTSLYKPVIDTLRAAGIAVVVASGNGSAPAAISSPACVSSSVSVGSTTKSDEVSYFSNSADMLSLLAPGSSITTSAPGANYYAQSGTSMAAPHVSGAWAVLKQAKPHASVTAVLDALQSTGVQVADKRSGAGNRATPRIDVQHALSALNTCQYNADCDDGVFCNGEETCSDGICIAGSWPCAEDTMCDEDMNECALPECEDDEDCFEGEICSRNMCVEEVVSELKITYTAPFAEKLKNDKKLKLKITGGEGFDPYSDIRVGTFSVLQKKPKVQYKNGARVKNEVQVTVLVPAGSSKGTVDVRMGSCSGQIEIL